VEFQLIKKGFKYSENTTRIDVAHLPVGNLYFYTVSNVKNKVLVKIN
jgi:hypothetical protein